MQAADRARSTWVRISANMSSGAYDVFEASASLTEPEWPELTFEQIVNIAFRDQFINSPNHVVLKKLRGEI